VTAAQAIQAPEAGEDAPVLEERARQQDRAKHGEQCRPRRAGRLPARIGDGGRLLDPIHGPRLAWIQFPGISSVGRHRPYKAGGQGSSRSAIMSEHRNCQAASMHGTAGTGRAVCTEMRKDIVGAPRACPGLEKTYVGSTAVRGSGGRGRELDRSSSSPRRSRLGDTWVIAHFAPREPWRDQARQAVASSSQSRTVSWRSFQSTGSRPGLGRQWSASRRH